MIKKKLVGLHSLFYTLVLSTIKVNDSITQQPQNAMENARFSYFFKDQITNLYNEDYFDYVITQNKFEPEYKSINIIFLHNFNNYNRTYSWQKGNDFLKQIALYLSEVYEDTLVFRIHGDDFIILSKEHITVNLKKLKDLPLLDNSLISISTTFYDLEKNYPKNIQEWKQNIN